jgi:hypothetical protein
MTGLHVAPATAEDWGEDRLGDSRLEPGQSIRIRLGIMRDCEFDAQASYDDGSREERHGIDLCHARQVSFDGSEAMALPFGEHEHRLTLVNHAGRPIQQAFVSSVEASEWGDDLLRQAVSTGAGGTISWRGQCTCDLRIVFDNRSAEERRGLDLCRTQRIEIRPGWTTTDTIPTGSPAPGPSSGGTSDPDLSGADINPAPAAAPPPHL